ncbi:acyloxyacyl hydrolase-like [Sycon ciliatum]|uniref:acyloxyacyl hydrolase-like n=1 Tax=Sycon ciliatum TaxID=27933 RepID=UPI0031F6FBDA
MAKLFWVYAFLLASCTLSISVGASGALRRDGLFGALLGGAQATRLADDTGGSACAGCAIMVGLVEQLSQLHNATVVEAIDKLCGYLPKDLHGPCDYLAKTYGPAVVEFLESKETSDVVCHAIGFCKTPAGTDMCHVFPLPPSIQHASSRRQRSDHISALRRRAEELAREKELNELLNTVTTGAFPNFCDFPVFHEVCKIIERWTEEHLPADDLDKDRYSDLASARGSSWRGKDCDDVSSNVHPGRKARDGDKLFDSNCNGISGVDHETGKTYEDMWCNGTGQSGVALLGDSIGAHFHIPPAWLNVTEMNELAFQHAIFALTNELDWPQLSMATGHYNASNWSPEIQGPMDSLYQRYVELNRCNHRDFQNAGVNGARSTSMAKEIASTLSPRNAETPPLLLIFELVGNDVCNGHPGTGHMTTPEEYYKAQMESLKIIDASLNKGSHVVLVGLADGRFLYDNMHARTHPLGALRNDVTYTDFYTYLNCLGVSPCWGWMNKNETWRNITSEHAFQLNAQLKKIADTQTFSNFDTMYMEYDIQSAADIWSKQGGQPWQLIEPVDGFHANQIGNALATQVFWNKIVQTKPKWLPARNPHNDDIVQRFGDQGGY